MEITLSEMIKELKYEICMRHAVYRRRIEAGKMTQETADHKIKIMEAVLETVNDRYDLTE